MPTNTPPEEVVPAHEVVEGVEYIWILGETITSNGASVRIVGRFGDKLDYQIQVELEYSEGMNDPQHEGVNELLSGTMTVTAPDPNLTAGMFSVEISGYNAWSPGNYHARLRYGNPQDGYGDSMASWTKYAS